MDSVMLGLLHLYRCLLHDSIYPQYKKIAFKCRLIAALGSGWTVSFVAAPIKQFKARLQLQYEARQYIFWSNLCSTQTVGHIPEDLVYMTFSNYGLQFELHLLVGLI